MHYNYKKKKSHPLMVLEYTSIHLLQEKKKQILLILLTPKPFKTFSAWQITLPAIKDRCAINALLWWWPYLAPSNESTHHLSYVTRATPTGLVRHDSLRHYPKSMVIINADNPAPSLWSLLDPHLAPSNFGCLRRPHPQLITGKTKKRLHFQLLHLKLSSLDDL